LSSGRSRRPPKLLAKNPVLLAKVIDYLERALIHPPGNGDQQKAEGSRLLCGFKAHYREYEAPLEPSQLIPVFCS
jgi:hypothetical protein